MSNAAAISTIRAPRSLVGAWARGYSGRQALLFGSVHRRARESVMTAQPLPAQTARPVAPVISLHDLKTHCASCSMRELCLPVGLDREALRTLDEMIGSRRKLRKGDALYRAGEAFGHLYAVRVGSLKTTVLAEDGREQVAGYHMLGDIIGLDGIGSERHGCDAIALEDTEVCAMAFGRLEELARSLPALQHNLHRFIAREITRDHDVMLLLGSMRAASRDPSSFFG
jgi:CRP/FNR family transcriptional regulator